LGEVDTGALARKILFIVKRNRGIIRKPGTERETG